MENLNWHPSDTDVNDDVNCVDDMSGYVDRTESILIVSCKKKEKGNR